MGHETYKNQLFQQSEKIQYRLLSLPYKKKRTINSNYAKKLLKKSVNSPRKKIFFEWIEGTIRKRENQQNVNACNCIIQFQFIIHNCSRELLRYCYRNRDFSCVYLVYMRSYWLAMFNVQLSSFVLHFVLFSLEHLMEISVTLATYWHIVPFLSTYMTVPREFRSINLSPNTIKFQYAKHTHHRRREYGIDQRKETKLFIENELAQEEIYFFLHYRKLLGYYLKCTTARSSSERKEANIRHKTKCTRR